MRRLNLILLAVAGVFLVWLLTEVGWGEIVRHLVLVGWHWPFLLLPYGVANGLEALAWGRLLTGPEVRPPWRWRFWIILGGEALNQLTPSASLGGEPFKATRLQAAGLPLDKATASLVIHKGLKVLALVFYIVLGLVLAAILLPGGGRHLRVLSLGAAALGVAALAFLWVQRRGPGMAILRFLEKLRLCPRALRDREAELARLDLHLAAFYRDHPGRGALALVLLFLAWLMHGVEVYVMFRLLEAPLGWGLAVCLDSLSLIFTSLGFIIPGALGFQEGGNVLLALGFLLGAPLGAAFSILRRLREAFWMGLGLAVVAKET